MSSKILKEWTTAAGLKAKVVLMSMGSINGYVMSPDKLVGTDYYGLDISVHGGLTYSKKEEDGYWFGFDTAHSGDRFDIERSLKEGLISQKIYDTRLDLESRYNSHGIIRTEEYVAAECESLAKQLQKLTRTITGDDTEEHA